MAKVLPEYLTKWTTKKVQAEGVTVMSQCEVDDAEMEGDRVKLTLNNGEQVCIVKVCIIFLIISIYAKMEGGRVKLTFNNGKFVNWRTTNFHNINLQHCRN